MDIVAPFITALIVLAQTTGPPEPGTPPQPPEGGMMQPIIMIGAMVLFMYLLLFRPQRQKEQEEKAMLERIKKNDHVVTRGGIIGVVMNVKDDEVVLKVDEQQNVKIRFQKAAIATILGAEPEKKEEEKKG
jgi:preprotein translocase subunit YajC